MTRLILKNVLPGSIIVTDGWKGYYTIKKDQNFTHETINHAIEFVNSAGLHSNTIEGTWSCLKYLIPIRMRVKEKVDFKVFEFIWRRKHENFDLWEVFIESLKNF
ncbi:hypothetical protein H312_01342 [Anncaliia algerae PRA339]|uniref:ISXO2-like transposase domain-containing protein n=1 Tax=Anncaliia algerae PRA339 TaxID=1288291 RepID=A0A059F2N6_9MICR|nr:hypothetical protein H312_01342 [Anncaliia algerae PRA339]